MCQNVRYTSIFVLRTFLPMTVGGPGLADLTEKDNGAQDQHCTFTVLNNSIVPPSLSPYLHHLHFQAHHEGPLPHVIFKHHARTQCVLHSHPVAMPTYHTSPQSS